MKKNRKFLAAAALVAVVASGGNAFTAALSGTEQQAQSAAVGTVEVAGANLQDLNYTYEGNSIEAVQAIFTGHFEPQAGTLVTMKVGTDEFTCGPVTLGGLDLNGVNNANDTTAVTCVGSVGISEVDGPGATAIRLTSEDTADTADTNGI